MLPPAFGYRTATVHIGEGTQHGHPRSCPAIIGVVADIPVLLTIGSILAIVGLILNLVPIGGTRRTYY